MPTPASRRRSAATDAMGVLLALAVLYGAMSFLVYRVIHMRHVAPLGPDALPGEFSEGRVLQHLRRLAVDIPGRQEGSPGLEAAAQYIKGQLEGLAAHAGPQYRVEVEETLVSGSFSMMFLRHRVTLGYRNHKNIVMRISSNVSEEDEPSLLVNGHFDSPLGSPGASDCGSCVASMLELSRLILESGWVPPRPVIFLFNGAEELFLLGSHGFIKTHKWNSTIGAFINIEASGSGGADLVCQSGPGSWPSRIYAQTAKYPMANSVAQDMFGIIPGDTDYRIFAEDIANIPGLDIIFVLGGYFYHTSYDTLENLLPGSIQARGENLFNLVKAFTNSSMLLKESERYNTTVNDRIVNPRAIFFDYMTWFMIFYPRDVSLILHSLPVAIFLLTPLFLNFPNITMMSVFRTVLDLARGMLLHAFGVSLAIVIPAMAAGLRLLFTKNAMNWFSHPYLAFFMFVPASLFGLLLPRFIWVLSEQSHFWGAFGLYSLITLTYVSGGSKWVIDSGCTSHMTGSSSIVKDLVSNEDQITVTYADKSKSKVMGFGKVVVAHDISLVNVMLVETLGYNLLSVRALGKMGFAVFIDDDIVVLMWSKSLKVAFVGYVENDLYVVDFSGQATAGPMCLYGKVDVGWLWHRQLAHVNMRTLQSLHKEGHIVGLKENVSFAKDRVCRACVLGKMHDAPHKPTNQIKSNKILELLHVDLFGPPSHASLGGKKYCLVIVDDFSRYSWVYFFKLKSETQRTFIDFINLVQRQHNVTVLIIRSDNGTEFKNYTLNDFLSDEGIKHQYSAAYTPQQNGVAERKNRTLIEMARTMLAEFKSPYNFWAKAVSTACHASNRLYLRKKINKTPYERASPPRSMMNDDFSSSASTNSDDESTTIYNGREGETTQGETMLQGELNGAKRRGKELGISEDGTPDGVLQQARKRGRFRVFQGDFSWGKELSMCSSYSYQPNILHPG